MISANGLTISKSSKMIIKNGSFRALPSEISVLSGPSGSGKTTLLRVIMGIEKPVSGRIKINDNTPYEFNISQKQLGLHAFGYVSQTLSLWPNMTIRNNIDLVNNSKNDPSMLLEVLEIGDLIDRYPRELSQGQQQRAAIVRAFIVKPKILLLDEATSSLDDDMSEKVWGLISEYVSTTDNMVLLITHDERIKRKANSIIDFYQNGDSFTLRTRK